MKSFPYLGLALCSAALLVQLQGFCQAGSGGLTAAQTGVESARAYQIAERGQDYAVWHRLSVATNHAGRLSVRTNRYVELETGKHYFGNGSWHASREEIQIVDDGAVATNGPHKVAFAANINSPVSVRVRTPDNKLLQLRVLGLAYHDFQAQTNVLIAELKDSVGQLVAANQVVYTNAFTDVAADVRYTYRKSGLEQDIILRQRPPLPEAFGLNPQTTRLWVLTEFPDPPADVRTLQQVRRGWKASMVDRVVDFGAMKIGPGTAFSLNSKVRRNQGVLVQKHWEVLEGRTFLIEEVSFPRLVGQLRELQAKVEPRGPARVLTAWCPGAKNIRLPGARLASRAPSSAPMQVAALPREQNGVVLDFNLVVDTEAMVFQGDTTYFVDADATVNLSGTTVIEGGAVIKFAPGSTINLLGAVQCQTGPYRPAIFTAQDDDSVGERITGSSGNPSGFYAACALNLGAGGDLKYVNIRYANTAIYCNGQDYSLSHAQILRCHIGLDSETANFTNSNVLMSRVDLPYYGSYFNGRVEHLTCDQAWVLKQDWNREVSGCEQTPSCSLTLVNSLTAALLNGYEATGDFPPEVFTDHCYDFRTAAGLFQTVGAGSYYLADGSPYRNAGTTAIEPGLLDDLQKKTTYPPLDYSNLVVTANTTLGPQAQRDTDLPDLGYHYDPLDYVFEGVTVAANVTFTAGTAVGWVAHVPDPETGVGWGIGLSSGSVAFRGTASQPCWCVAYNTVQEEPYGPTPSFYSTWAAIMFTGQQPGNPGQLTAQFAKWATCAGPYYQHLVDAALPGTTANISSSEFYNGAISLYDSSRQFFNTLFSRVGVGAYSDDSATQCSFQNCLFWNGALSLAGSYNSSLSTWIVRNTAFDSCAIYCAAYGDSGYSGFSANAYITGQPKLQGTNPNPGDQQVSTFNWQSGRFGNFYLPQYSSLIEGGLPTDAGMVGLYHYTTSTFMRDGVQVKEEHTKTDVGYHYVAVDASGNPIDTDGDGMPDYLEDTNGNGGGYEPQVDRSDWASYDSPNGLSAGNGLQVFIPR